MLARVGAGSLHGAWVSGGAPRDWDLHLGPLPARALRVGSGVVVGEVIPGPEWAGLREYLRRWDGWVDPVVRRFAQPAT